MGQRGPQSDKAFPESEWFDRNVEMLKRVDPDRRDNYLNGVRLVRGEAAEKALEAVKIPPHPVIVKEDSYTERRRDQWRELAAVRKEQRHERKPINRAEKRVMLVPLKSRRHPIFDPESIAFGEKFPWEKR